MRTRVKTEDLRAEITFLDNSIISDQRQIHATEFQLDLMRKALKRKRARRARLLARFNRQWDNH